MFIGKVSNSQNKSNPIQYFITFLLRLDPLHIQLETTSLNLVRKYNKEYTKK